MTPEMRASRDLIEHHLCAACDLAVAWVENEARRILRENAELEEFYMAMGVCGFTVEIDSRETIHPDYYNCDSIGENEFKHFAWAKELEEFLLEYDATLHITGTPMRFTANGEKITDW